MMCSALLWHWRRQYHYTEECPLKTPVHRVRIGRSCHLLSLQDGEDCIAKKVALLVVRIDVDALSRCVFLDQPTLSSRESVAFLT